jgi:hypothetical protein
MVIVVIWVTAVRVFVEMVVSDMTGVMGSEAGVRGMQL